MSEPWEAEILRVPDVSWQAHTPPARHPVPTRYVRGLEAGQELTIGIPGRWFIDGQVLAGTERGSTALDGATEDQEALAVAAPFAFWLSRGFPHVRLTMQWWPVAWSWIYRDAVTPGEDHPEEPPADDGAGSWLDHVRPSLGEPPVRHPHPARDAGSLTGRTVRLQHEPGRWSWWVAVSEPFDADGDIVVPVMRPSDYWLAQAAFSSAVRAQQVPLHRLHVYA